MQARATRGLGTGCCSGLRLCPQLTVHSGSGSPNQAAPPQSAPGRNDDRKIPQCALWLQCPPAPGTHCRAWARRREQPCPEGRFLTPTTPLHCTLPTSRRFSPHYRCAACARGLGKVPQLHFLLHKDSCEQGSLSSHKRCFSVTHMWLPEPPSTLLSLDGV